MTIKMIGENIVKYHLMLCCNYSCLRETMVNFKRHHRNAAEVNYTDRKIAIGNDQFFFIADINNHLEKIRGIRCVDYRVCDGYDLSSEAKEQLKALVR